MENYRLQVDDYSQECVELEKRLEIYETQLLEVKKNRNFYNKVNNRVITNHQKKKIVEKNIIGKNKGIG